jgi:Cys-tRNA(Pro)/Cys-tRNA(Cys) deacylase
MRCDGIEYLRHVQKTQAMRMLDQRGIRYEARTYDAGGDFHTGAEAAALLGVDPASVYKTLVVLREGSARTRPLIVVLPVAEEIDLKRLARLTGDKKLRMATRREAEQLTGMQAGGISPLALRSGVFDVLLDERAAALPALHVSAGARGIDLALRPDDFVAVTGAHLVALRG